ncbi:hypothetical protein NWFMUON74_64140 [Nocardia wallacei]|uniref:Uncharacterized protein n=1 Tax=Nocardia wallacei TaxID=480035 RepID=A0A7G1KU77_9NOCA|nr:hypothetical protein NWFMUON74_64140 [Nocardia wallacei]
MRSGRGPATSSRRPEPTWLSTRAASAPTVDASNSSRTGIRVSSALPSRATTWVAISELPPSSKKSSSTPIGVSRASTVAKVFATISSIGVEAARNSRTPNTGSGSARRSSLPFAPSGRASSTTNAAGIM